MSKFPTNVTKRAEPLLVSVVETANLLNISKRTVEKMIADGSLPSCRLRRRRLVPLEILRTLAMAGEGIRPARENY